MLLPVASGVSSGVGRGTLQQPQVTDEKAVLRAGDKLDFVVWPKDDHDCDAALLLEAKIWDSSEFKETTTF